jgi:hypothetical protein
MIRYPQLSVHRSRAFSAGGPRHGVVSCCSRPSTAWVIPGAEGGAASEQRDTFGVWVNWVNEIVYLYLISNIQYLYLYPIALYIYIIPIAYIYVYIYIYISRHRYDIHACIYLVTSKKINVCNTFQTGSIYVPSIFECASLRKVHGHWCSGLGPMVLPKPIDPGGEGEHGPGSVDPLSLWPLNSPGSDVGMFGWRELPLKNGRWTGHYS